MKKIFVFCALFFLVFSFNSVFCEIDENYPVFENVSYRQGQNKYGALGTCMQTSIANAMNLISNTSDYSEEFVLDFCLEKGYCRIAKNPDGEKSVYIDGMSSLLHDLCFYMNQFDDTYSYWGDYMSILQSNTSPMVAANYTARRLLDMNKIFTSMSNDKFDRYTVFLMFVNSDAMFYDTDFDSWSFYDMETRTFDLDGKYDHMILVQSPVINEDGTLKGFVIVDSGGINNYIDAEKLGRIADFQVYAMSRLKKL